VTVKIGQADTAKKISRESRRCKDKKILARKNRGKKDTTN
jgi:hypothetical protein